MVSRPIKIEGRSNYGAFYNITLELAKEWAIKTRFGYERQPRRKIKKTIENVIEFSLKNLLEPMNKHFYISPPCEFISAKICPKIVNELEEGRKSPPGIIEVRLNFISGSNMKSGNIKPWIVYQFAHEFCHSLVYPENLDSYKEIEEIKSKNLNIWFEETLCELFSLLILDLIKEKNRKMDLNWLWNFAIEPEKDLENWLRTHEESLKLKEENGFSTEFLYSREKGKGRELMASVSKALLPLFQKNPLGWNAIRKLPYKSNGQFNQYLHDWYEKVDLETEQEFVRSIAKEFGVKIK